MAEIYPSKQVMVDLKDGNTVTVSVITLPGNTTDHLFIPNADDAQLLASTRTASDPTFYLTQGGTQFNIDSGTANTEYILVSRSSGGVNRFRGRATPNDDNAA